jgi:hypothetical protein
VPVKNLPENILHLIYYGDKDQGGDFEGVINNLERR